MSNIRALILAFAALITVLVASGAEPPAPRGRAEVEAVLARAPGSATGELRPLKVLLVAYRKDHGPNEHDYPLWQKRWRLLLGGEQQAPPDAGQINLYGPAVDASPAHAGAPKIEVNAAWGWPSPEQLAQSDLVVTHCYVNWDATKLVELKAFLARGGGWVLVHPACIVPTTDIVGAVTELTGLAWEYGYTGFRHGPLDLRITAPDHPICLGLH
ncbi:hypothetical protein HS125_06550 [bacterium]|nr:hypothetical protein [bacterium]